MSKVSFLGYIISANRVAIDDEKLDAIRKLPSFSFSQGVTKIPGFSNIYRRFIRNFSLIATPLPLLLKGRLQKDHVKEALIC